MVARYDIDRNLLGEFKQRRVGEIHYLCWHFAAEEEIAAMDYEVGVYACGMGQDTSVVCEEFLASSSALDPRPDGIVETQMGVCKEDETDWSMAVSHSGSYVREDWFCPDYWTFIQYTDHTYSKLTGQAGCHHGPSPELRTV